MGTNIKVLQAAKTQIVEVSQTGVAVNNIKGIRIDQSGVLTIDLNDQGSQTWNVVQGEILQIQGSVSLTTDSACRLVVYL